MEYGIYTTKVKDNKGRVWDLGKGEHVPDEENVWAVNAWTELVKRLDVPKPVIKNFNDISLDPCADCEHSQSCN